jgi:hypothetical protein
MQWNGKRFVPLYRSHLGKPTRQKRAGQKQSPTGNVTSICRRVAGTHLVVLPADGDENA